ncbi:hypothetical protein [Legionella hackeliae]|uniref:Uncharacterized protein n=1 Tax=Legionella hackeliae TaxID=449 RepID=A0A0A8UT62_LEGHA|nr:hypothetical protein [Legionella hackeliae]KTD12624.1 hypothetical protein Lhac_1495 [Legionella hackeliae]CEK12040.1 protein of unknown function [Legionella hackeliae]STX48826.1 Uncharacterised protein [Legionella hackeliae]
MKRYFFKPAKRKLKYSEYLDEILILARRIGEVSPGKQLYSSAQFELALVSFGDLKALKKEMAPDIEVEFPELKSDWLAGFDWLDLAVSYHDEDAISYFQERLENKNFSKIYKQYKENCRPDCALQRYELNIPQLNS